jgi:predicted metal-binding membrane protein
MDGATIARGRLSPQAALLPVAALALVALLALWLLGRSPYGHLLHHDGVAAADAPATVVLVLPAVGWTLMVVALMLPTALPLLNAFARVVAGRATRRRLVSLAAVGFLATWVAFGQLLFAADLLLVHSLVDRVDWLQAHSYLVGAATLAGAGLYQFSSLKTRCLTRCRTPASFLYGRWTGGRRAAAESFEVGTAYGLSCLGCCWTLMLVMFAAGAGNLGWMLALGAVMGLEKNSAWGTRLTYPLGALLLASALLVLITERTAFT